MTSPQVLEDRTGAKRQPRPDRSPVSASSGRGSDLRAASLLDLSTGGVELAGLGGPLSAVLAGNPVRAQAAPLPRRLGGRARLLAAIGPVGAAHRPDGMAGLGGPGTHLLVLVAGVLVPGAARGLPAESPAHDGGTDSLGRTRVRSHHLLTGFPWYYLGHSQFRFLALIQVADVEQRARNQLPDRAGQRMVRRSAVAAALLRRSARGTRLTRAHKRSACGRSTLLVGGTLVYGAYRLSTAQFREGPRLALLQTNLPQRYKMGGDPWRSSTGSGI